jgi:adenosylhomocysteine nucleosidase
MAILFVASEAAELEPLARILTASRKLKWPIDYAQEGIWESRRFILAANGEGPKLAAHAVEVAIRAGMVAELSSSKLEAVVAAGWCGALHPALRECEIFVATEVLDVASGERFSCGVVAAKGSAFTTGVLVAQDRVANDSAEKAKLAAEYGAQAVDMESAGIAARAKRAGLPFFCIKAISDRADESFPFDLNRMRTPEGRISRGRIIVQAVTHPNQVPSLFRLKRRTRDAAHNLGEFLVSCRITAEAANTAQSG